MNHEIDSVIKSDIKKSIIIRTHLDPTRVVVLALNPFKNSLIAIPRKDKGTLIGGYVFDSKFGNYYADCVAYADLGVIPISFSIKVAKINRWESRIPVGENVIAKYLDNTQTSKLKEFKETHKDCNFDYMQIVSDYN